MAFPRFLRNSILLLHILFPTSHSLTCTSQNLTNSLYKNCIDLPTLNSYLRWTYHASNSSLFVAFLALASPNDWISWAINPSSAGMVGAQSLIALRQSDGSMSVKTYNISSYETIVQSDILFNVSDLSAQYSNGIMKILATLELPENTEVVNQVWQVGGSVIDGETPGKHGLEDANLNAKGKLHLLDHAKITATSADANSSGTWSSRCAVNGTSCNVKYGTSCDVKYDPEAFCVSFLMLQLAEKCMQQAGVELLPKSP
ncbi:auxin-induced in root cultures protein 12-like [Apium graveolens]|uniref:auxin-induced in root cultures protein 12-like n=1 Tax=Apium graveolens TaxID=4045 RepID=UPI003D7A1268